MAPWEPSTWTATTWLFYTLGATFWLFFHITWLRFRSLERSLAKGEVGAVESWNRAVSGFPGSAYAKMMGKRRLE